MNFLWIVIRRADASGRYAQNGGRNPIRAAPDGGNPEKIVTFVHYG